MRAIFAGLLMLSIAGPAAAGADQTFAERRALLAADQRCDLFTPALRQALEASTFQARTTLLRNGWTADRADRLGRAAAAEVRARPCDDAVLISAAAQARAGFTGWTQLMSMRFPGVDRAWLARRAPDPQGFYLRQDVSAPRPAVFGIRRDGAGGSLALLLPLGPREAAPAAARLSYRDVARAPRSPADTPGRVVTGLAGSIASPATAKIVMPRARQIMAGEKGARFVLFTFPDAAMADLKSLDPRDALQITFEGAPTLLIEVGDLAAAHAFLAAEGAE